MLHRLLDQDAYTAQEHSSSKYGTAAFNKQSAATKVQSQIHLREQCPEKDRSLVVQRHEIISCQSIENPKELFLMYHQTFNRSLLASV